MLDNCLFYAHKFTSSFRLNLLGEGGGGWEQKMFMMKFKLTSFYCVSDDRTHDGDYLEPVQSIPNKGAGNYYFYSELMISTLFGIYNYSKKMYRNIQRPPYAVQFRFAINFLFYPQAIDKIK